MDIILKYTLKKIQEQTSLIPNINYGGCCHFAKLLAKELESRNINYKVTLFDSYLPLEKISKSIKNKEFKIGVGHVAIKIGNYYIDGYTISKNANNLLNGIGGCDNFSNFKINYSQLPSISKEIKEKLEKFKPVTLGEALKISGVTPAAILHLYNLIKNKKIIKANG